MDYGMLLKLYCAQILSAVMLFAPLWVILWSLRRFTTRQAIYYCVFTVYLGWVYALAGIISMRYLFVSEFAPRVNLIPFVGMLSAPFDTVLNILMFAPLGFLCPLLWEHFRDWKSTLLLGFGTSLAIELLQMVSGRTTDIDDLITNVVGTLLGFAIAKLICRMGWKSVADGRKDAARLYIITVLVMFFLHPYVLDPVWGLM